MEDKLMRMSLILIACVSAFALTACATPNRYTYNPIYGPDHPVNDPMCGGVAYHCDMHRDAPGPWDALGH